MSRFLLYAFGLSFSLRVRFFVYCFLSVVMVILGGWNSVVRFCENFSIWSVVEILVGFSLVFVRRMSE